MAVLGACKVCRCETVSAWGQNRLEVTVLQIVSKSGGLCRIVEHLGSA